MSNTNQIFKLAKEYQDKREMINNAFNKRATEIEDAKGSRYYDTEIKKATDTQRTALENLSKEYVPLFDNVLQAMKKANENRGMTPPTEEELRLLQLLKMKEKITEAELDAAANTLKGNATCLAVLTEISRKQGYIRGYMSYSDSKEMPVETTESIIRELVKAIRDFIEYDTPKAARIAREYHEAYYGAAGDPLPKRPLFSDKSGCFSELIRISGDELTAFCKAVDG